MSIQNIIGGILVIISILVIWAFQQFFSHPAAKSGPLAASSQVEMIHGYVGGEKMGLVENQKIKDILRTKYNIELQPEKRGSLQMVTTEPLDGIDFIWPGSQVELEIYKKTGKPFRSAEILFNSPIVVYSWDIVEAALSKAGIVQKEQDTSYIVDMPKLAEAITQKTSWKQIGLPELFGSVKVACTDPSKSNSGNQFLCLLGTVIANQETLSMEDVPKVAPTLKTFLRNLGFMENSSGDLFDKYIKQGVGAYPMAAGYENQIIEFSVDNKEYLKAIQSKLRILYPKPTVWSSHPMIALDDKGKKLIDAMKDPDIQRIAWMEHGFRTGSSTISTDPTKLGFSGIPLTITAIVSMPTPEVVENLISQTKP